jgi:hypothetical protein
VRPAIFLDPGGDRGYAAASPVLSTSWRGTEERAPLLRRWS